MFSVSKAYAYRRDFLEKLFLQGTGVQSSGIVASLSKAFDSNVVRGNYLGVVVVTYPSSGPTPVVHTVSDSRGNSYSSLIRFTGMVGDTAVAMEIHRAIANSTGPCTVTVDPITPDGQGFVTFGIAAFSGAKLTDVTKVGTSANSVNVSTGNFTTNFLDAILAGCSHIGPTMAITPAANWNQFYENQNGANMPINCVWRIPLGPSGVFNAQWTLGTATPWGCLAVGVK